MARLLGIVAGRPARKGRHAPGLILLCLMFVAGWSRAAPVTVIEEIQLVGNGRTAAETVWLYFPLRPGDPVDQEQLLAAVDELRQSELFNQVSFYSRPGSRRGLIVIVLEVQEKSVEIRLGTGYSDLDGWYLIPAELALDNRLGRGEQIRLQSRIGYRHAGLVFAFDEPRVGDGRSYWGLEASVLATDRVYFTDGIEYRHKVERSAVEVHLGRRLARFWSGELGARIERVDVDSFSTVQTTDEVRDVERGDELPWSALPPRIASAAGERSRAALHLQLRLDSRSRRLVAGTPAGGLWGQVRLEGFLQGDDSFGAVSLDMRGYQAVPGGTLALRARLGGVGEKAPFYDRQYLGGLYTVRGFPSQSLSAPAGDTWFWSASCEYRAPLIGHSDRPRLAGLLFCDAGDSWSEAPPTWADAAVSAGFGVRLRVIWVGWIGLDLALPLTESAVDESFRAHASIGWTF
jgi:outer membrane protein assembly factor BamA